MKTNTEGLPRREWFKHQIYAPGFYTGYGVKTMPQIREGLEEGRFTEAQGGVRTVSAAVNALTAQVEQAAQALQQAGWSETDIVILSQLASFLSFQIRLVAGLRVLGARAAVATASSTIALQTLP